MILINHRANSIKDLKKTNVNFGVEIDLRSDKKKIYLHHDPYQRGVEFKEWLRYYKHKLIVLNVKEEGLENKILKFSLFSKLSNWSKIEFLS